MTVVEIEFKNGEIKKLEYIKYDQAYTKAHEMINYENVKRVYVKDKP